MEMLLLASVTQNKKKIFRTWILKMCIATKCFCKQWNLSFSGKQLNSNIMMLTGKNSLVPNDE